MTDYVQIILGFNLNRNLGMGWNSEVEHLLLLCLNHDFGIGWLYHIFFKSLFHLGSGLILRSVLEDGYTIYF